jgi:hypothetical protein
MDIKIAKFSIETSTVPPSFTVSNDKLINIPLNKYNFENELNVRKT